MLNRAVYAFCSTLKSVKVKLREIKLAVTIHRSFFKFNCKIGVA